MSDSPSPVRFGLCVVALLAALSLVAWRQGRAMTVMAEVDDLRTEISLTNAQNDNLRQRIQYLESRRRIVDEARDRLDMRMPEAAEITTLPGGLR